MTYETVDSYVMDTLTFHDNRLLYQPNSINDKYDGIFQTTSITVMRAVAPRFFQHSLRRGPFAYMLNDIHQSNILVDENWNIKYLIDLEWACSRPIEMLHPPYWLTSQSVDTIDTDIFASLHKEFVELMELEERETHSGDIMLSGLMKQGWESGTFWYSLALTSTMGLYSIFQDHIRPRVADDVDGGWFHKVLMNFWRQYIGDFISRKLQDRADYDKKLQEEFDVRPEVQEA